MPWVLGVDGGGNRTVALVANEKGKVLGRGEDGPSNYHVAGLGRAMDALRNATLAAIADSGLVPNALAASFFGVAGMDRPVDRQVMASALAGLNLGGKLQLDNNAVATLAGATGNRPGVVVIAGTGSIAYGENAAGEQCRSGGYGPLLGDEGSAYDIGRRALVAALRSEDGRGPATVLSDHVKQRFMLETVLDLTHLVHGDPPALGRTEIANLAPLVIRCAEAGDGTAREILRVAGRELGLAAAAVLQRLEFTTHEILVAGSGDVFSAGNILMLPMRQVIHSVAPGALLISPRHTPAVGAIMLALRSIGIHLEEPAAAETAN